MLSRSVKHPFPFMTQRALHLTATTTSLHTLRHCNLVYLVAKPAFAKAIVYIKMGLRPTTGEKIAYFVAVVVLVSLVLLGTYFFLRRRNRKILDQRSPSIPLLPQTEANQIRHQVEHSRGLANRRAPQIPPTHYRSNSRDTTDDFTSQWAREQALVQPKDTPRPPSIYPESSISNAPRLYHPSARDRSRGRQAYRQPRSPSSPIRSISPLSFFF